MSLNQANVQPQYESFEPPLDWDHDEGSSSVIVAIPGFKKEQMRVQITSTRMLRLTGERKISDSKIRRFYKELPIPADTDTGGITAKFESGILYVRLPKIITSIKQEQEPPKPTTTTPTQAEEAQKTQQQQAKIPEEAPKNDAPQDIHQKPRDRVDAEHKTEKTEQPTPTETEQKTEKTEQPTPTETEQKTEETEQQKNEESDGRKVEGTSTREKGELGKRSPTLELVSRQSQEYKNAVYGFVEEIKRQRKLANLLVMIFLVLVFVMYVKNAIKSSFGGPKSPEL